MLAPTEDAVYEHLGRCSARGSHICGHIGATHRAARRTHVLHSRLHPALARTNEYNYEHEHEREHVIEHGYRATRRRVAGSMDRPTHSEHLIVSRDSHLVGNEKEAAPRRDEPARGERGIPWGIPPQSGAPRLPPVHVDVALAWSLIYAPSSQTNASSQKISMRPPARVSRLGT